MNATILELINVEKHYQNGDTTVRALDGVSLTIRRGEFVAIEGRSGSGLAARSRFCDGTSFSIAARKSAGRIGLHRYSSMPAARHFSRSPAIA